MLQTVEAVIDEDGTVRLMEAVRLPSARRALVTILEQEPDATISLDAPVREAALLSEAALAVGWLREEEEEAWVHLQKEPSPARVKRQPPA